MIKFNYIKANRKKYSNSFKIQVIYNLYIKSFVVIVLFLQSCGKNPDDVDIKHLDTLRYELIIDTINNEDYFKKDNSADIYLANNLISLLMKNNKDYSANQFFSYIDSLNGSYNLILKNLHVTTAKIYRKYLLKPVNKGSISLNTNGYERNAQYIHPAIAYSETPIGGYRYWMFASNYPNNNGLYEDEDLLVSNDAITWYRVMPSSLETDVTKPVLPPNAFDISPDKGRENSFVPIPKAGMNIKMNGIDYKPGRTLKHDPEIYIKDGEVFLYNFYNFYDDVSMTNFHRFVCVISTKDGKNWFINRKDGSKLIANSDNLKELFTQSSVDGKENYIRYFNNSTKGTSLNYDSNMQIVYDGVNWWAYYGMYSNYNYSNLGIKRYKGSSNLNFNWDEEEFCKSLVPLSLATTHWGIKFYNSKFYVIGGYKVFESNDGLSFRQLAMNPNTHIPVHQYKVTTCIGENGKFIVALGSQFQRNTLQSPLESGGVYLNDIVTTIEHFDNFNQFVQESESGKKGVSLIAIVTVKKVNNKGEIYLFNCLDSNFNSNSDFNFGNFKLEKGDKLNVGFFPCLYGLTNAQISFNKNILLISEIK